MFKQAASHISGNSVPPPGGSLSIQKMKSTTVVLFSRGSLFDPVELVATQEALFALVDLEDRRKIVLDFTGIELVSSQAVGVILGIRARLDKLRDSQLIVCGVGPRMAELLKICGLQSKLMFKTNADEAVRYLNVA